MSSAVEASAPSAERRPILFLSHAGADTEAARRLAERIEATPEARAAGLKVWLDKKDLEPGRSWQEQLERAIEELSTAFAVYLGSSGVVNWVDGEVRLALSRARREPGYRFIPIISGASAGSDALPAFARQYQGVGDLEQDPAELAKLIQAVLEREPGAPVQLVGRPFIGLVPFDEADSHVFFGREEESEELVERLRRNPLLIVVGDSGSGKSSLVRAGLVPRFRGGALADRSGDHRDESVWHVVVTRPRAHPFDTLADAVAEAGRAVEIDASTLGTVKDWIRTERPEKVRDALLHSAPAKAKILLVVDQFEELLTLAGGPARRPYLDALLHLVADPGNTTVRIALTMRRDYYNLCSQYPAFYQRLDADGGSAQYALRRIAEEGLRACVREPLKLAGVEDSRVLEDEIVKDVGDQPSELALVQMALSEAWRVRQEFAGDLLRAYIGRGRVAGALAKAADEVYEQKLGGDERALAEAIFIRLVQLGDTGGTTRRLATRDEFSGDSWVLVQKLATEDHRRLVVIRGEEGAETAELAHEALVTQWPRYQNWLQASALHKRIHDWVIPAAKTWTASGRSRKERATGSRLEDARKLVRDRPTWLSWEERRFVEASRAAERRRSWGDRAVVAVLVALTIVAGYNWLEADRQRDEALQKESLLLARLADEQTGGGDAVTGMLVALRALPNNLDSPDRPIMPEVEASLLRGMYAQHERLVLRRHEGPVRSVAWSPDGERLATASEDSTARVWDAAKGEELLSLPERAGPVLSVAWSPDGKRLATGMEDGTARLLDAGTGEELLHLPGHARSVLSVAWSPDGSRLATAGWDGTEPRLWDAGTGRGLLVLRGHEGWVISVAWSPDGTRLATASEDGTTRLWDAARGEELLVLRAHDEKSWVNSVAWSPDGTRLATASGEGIARLWDAATGQQLRVLRGHGGEVYSVTWSPDGERLATASMDETTRLWDSATGNELLVLRGHAGLVWSAAWSPDGKRLATASEDGTARLWDTTSRLELRVLAGHEGPVSSVAWSPDGERLATASEDSTARVWDAAKGEELLPLRGHGGAVVSVAWSPDGTHVATASEDGTARVWDPATGRELDSLDGHMGRVLSVAWSPDGARLATASGDETVRLWHAASGEELLTLRGHAGPVWSVAWSPDGARLASASADETARLWDAATGEELLALRGHAGPVWSAAWSPPDGTRVATASWEGIAQMWDAATGEEPLFLRGHGGPVRSVAWSPDGARLATASDDGTARLWDAATRREVAVLGGHENGVRSVAWSPDGGRLATGSQDKTARVWWLPKSVEELVDEVRRRLPREQLTPEQERRFYLRS